MRPSLIGERMSRRRKSYVLVIAPAQGRGGIASVVRLHSQTETWKSMRCRLLSTYDDRGAWRKIGSAIKAYGKFPFLIGKAAAVHVHLAAQKSVLRKLPFVLAAKLLGKPVVVHVHAFSVESLFDETPFSAGQYILKLADRVVVLSESWSDAIRARDGSLQTIVMPNPVLAKPTRSVEPTGSPVVLFAGKLEMRKGYQDLLQAAPLVLALFPKTQFWFAGHGELEAAAELAEKLGISQSIKLLGWLTEEEMSKTYDAATVFCLPSYNEGVPMVVLEAMGRGLPVVCTRVGGLPDFVQDDSNGLFVAPGDAASIASAVSQLLADPLHAGRIGEAAARTIRSRCSLDSTSKQLEALYASVLGESVDKNRSVRVSSPVDIATPLPEGMDVNTLGEGVTR